MNEIQVRGLKVVAVDALPEQFVWVERGLVPVLWAQPLYDWGAVGVSSIVDRVLLKKAVPRSIPMELIRVTKDTLRPYARRLREWGFSVPQEYLGP
jgi:ABC-type sugar transport system substrate-binding protein